MTVEEQKCRCGKPSDGWPDTNGGELCQMCWEADCSESWWKMVALLAPVSAEEKPEGLCSLTNPNHEQKKSRRSD